MFYHSHQDLIWFVPWLHLQPHLIPHANLLSMLQPLSCLLFCPFRKSSIFLTSFFPCSLTSFHDWLPIIHISTKCHFYQPPELKSGERNSHCSMTLTYFFSEHLFVSEMFFFVKVHWVVVFLSCLHDSRGLFFLIQIECSGPRTEPNI